MSAPVSLGQVLDATANSIVDGLHTCLPGKIVAFHAGTQTADIAIVVKRVAFDENRDRVVEEFPVLNDIPIQYPRGGGFVIAFPLAVGDHCLVVFSEIATGEWRATGQLSEPFDVRRHGLSGAFCIPGIAPDTVTLSSTTETALETKLVLGKDTATSQIHIGTDIKLGTTATDYVAMSTAVQTALTAILTAFNQHTHVCAAAGVASASPLPQLVANSSIAATIVKAL